MKVLRSKNINPQQKVLNMNFKHCMVFLTVCLTQSALASDIAIQKNVFNSTLRITASPDRFAGAIYSVTFRDKEYINSTDHGRELQSASSFDGLGECFNPTEAGSAADANGPTSSSVLINYSTSGYVMQTATKMAFWLQPGQPYGQPCGTTQFTTAQNSTIVSDHVLSKTVSIGYQEIPNVVRYDVAFKVPEAHQSATFEALTGYMPPGFSVFLAYDPLTRTLSSLSDGPGEQSRPVMLATSDGRHAMGISSFNLPQATFPNIGYGRFRFRDTTKWNCVFREVNIAAKGTYSYTCLVAIGTVDEVIAAQNALYSSGNRPAPLFRFFNGIDHFLTASYDEGAGARYGFEGTAFHVYSAYLDGGMVPIYRCYVVASRVHFVSRHGNCEGQRVEGTYGFISAYYRAGFIALHRFYHTVSGGHLTTTNYSEGINAGYSYEGVLGYVPTS